MNHKYIYKSYKEAKEVIEIIHIEKYLMEKLENLVHQIEDQFLMVKIDIAL
jgi:hypothetical protein